jgi:hypothetical protein
MSVAIDGSLPGAVVQLAAGIGGGFAVMRALLILAREKTDVPERGSFGRHLPVSLSPYGRGNEPAKQHIK